MTELFCHLTVLLAQFLPLERGEDCDPLSWTFGGYYTKRRGVHALHIQLLLLAKKKKKTKPRISPVARCVKKFGFKPRATWAPPQKRCIATRPDMFGRKRGSSWI
jgi:hypothetical protein